MQKVLTAEQMREVDRLTTERYGIPSILLMENAAHAVARVITEKLGESVDGKAISILCGKGNNGGDGAALARILWSQGTDVDLYLFGRVEDTKGDARVNFDAVKNLNDRDPPFSPYLFVHEESLIDAKTEQVIMRSHVIVDAIFGTGLTRPVDTVMGKLFRNIDLRKDRVGRRPLLVSIDLPTGLNADSATDFETAFNADITVTFTAPKPANVLAPNFRKNGVMIVAQIGTPYELLDEAASNLGIYDAHDISWGWMRSSRFSDDSYKNERGHALIFAGSGNYSGAAVMCGNAAIRSGVGLVTLAVPASVKSEIAARLLPEVIVRSIAEDTRGVSDSALSESRELLKGVNAITIGPGLAATDKGVEKLVREIVENRTTPMIADAGALWFFNPPDGIFHSSTLQKPAHEQVRNTELDNRTPIILTPHEGEFMRLLGTDDKEAIKDRVAAVRAYSQQHGVILVLKGERVLIGAPDGRVVVNPTGNSGLGKAGNGDTLTGILAGFVAQAEAMNIDIFETVVVAVFVAGMAGDIAERKYGKRVMTASDVRECLTDVFEVLSK